VPADVDVRLAREHELERTVRLRWHWAREIGDEPEGSQAEFTANAAEWARSHADTHLPHVAVASDGEIVGMVWLALTPRVATPRSLDRWSGDLQSCYVLPEFRGQGIGGALVRAALATARERGAEHVTVHASAKSVGLYARNGFRGSDRLLWADVSIAER
jgi:ribosomal protein S18 acetylase RimI-like enzyme